MSQQAIPLSSTQTEAHQQSAQETVSEENADFDGSDFDYSEFTKTIDEISDFVKKASDEQKTLIIDNLITKMKCMAQAISTLNIKNQSIQIEKDKLIQLASNLEGKCNQLEQQQISTLKQKQNIVESYLSKYQESERRNQEMENQLKEEKERYEKRVENLLASIKELQNKQFEARIRSEEDRKALQSMEEQLTMIYRFTNLEEKTVYQMKRKFSSQDNNTLVLGAQQLNELRDYAEKMIKENRSLEMISEKSQEDRQSEIKSHQDLFKATQSPASPIAKFTPRRASSKNIEEDELDDTQIQINELKNLMWKRSSIRESCNEESTQLEFIQPHSQAQKQLISSLKEQYTKKRVTQSEKASSILFKLDQNRVFSNQYTLQLEQELGASKLRIAQLQEKLQMQRTEKLQEITTSNEKIEELMTKVEVMQEQRIRNQRLYGDLDKKLTSKTREISDLQEYVHKIESQKKKIEEKLEQLKNQMVDAGENALNMQYSLKSATDEYSQINCQKILIEEQSQHQKQTIEKLQQQILELTANFDNQRNRCLSLQSNYAQIAQKSKQYTTLQTKLSEYELCIEELQQKLSEMISIKNRLQTQNKKLTEQANRSEQLYTKLQKQNSSLHEDIQKLQTDYRIIEKSNQDFKYMNELLKKDNLKIKAIQDRNWMQELSETKSTKAKQNDSSFIKKRASNNYSNVGGEGNGRNTDRLRNNNSFISESGHNTERVKETGENRMKMSAGSTFWKNVRERNSGSLYETRKQPKKEDQQISMTEALKKKYML